MHLVSTGLNHERAPIEVRERVAFAEAELPRALDQFRALPDVAECAILSTCNRTELYAVHHGRTTAESLVAFLSEYHGVSADQFAGHIYHHAARGVAEHLLRVACGLDSLVLGEPQILRQVRDAFAAASNTRAAGPVINSLFRAAIATGRRARTETDIGRGGFSVGRAAVDLARSIFGSLADATILILGAGKMSELTAKHLMAHGVKAVLVANRTFERAHSIADRLGGQAIRYDEFPERLISADVVISSTAAPSYVVTREIVQSALRRRRGRPLFFVDIAVPRDIDPAVARLDNVFVYDLDDLQAVVADMARERAADAERAEAIVAEEADKFMQWWRSLDAAPLVTQMIHKHERIRRSELERLRNQLPDLPPATWEKIEAATRSMMTRVNRDPIHTLKGAATGSMDASAMDLPEAARLLLGLTEEPAAPESQPIPESETLPPIEQAVAATRRQEGHR